MVVAFARRSPGAQRFAFPAEAVEGSLVSRFASVCAAFGARTAIRHAGDDTSYAELDARSDTLARQLLASPRDREVPVALLYPQGVDAVAALLGVLKAGMFYVALDPRQPTKRNAALLADSRASVLFAADEFRDLAAELRALAETKAEVLTEDRSRGPHVESLPMVADGNAFAYLIYTSGSTGTPKGAIQTHRNVLADIWRQSRDFAITPGDRFGLVYHPSSSASICHIFGALLNGACLLPFDLREQGLGKAARWLKRERITILDINVSAFRHLAPLMPTASGPDSLRILSPGSEPVLRRDFDLYRKYFGEACIMQNALGTTETRTATQAFYTKSSSFEGSLVPVGSDVWEKRTLLVGENGAEVEHGESGEIVIESRYLSPGYWNRPDLTEAAFSAVEGRPGIRRYRTGDIGRRLGDGSLLHLGRRDQQVKIRGYRVELGEIESALAAHPAVADAAASLSTDATGNDRIAAHVVLRGKTVVGITELREFLRVTLPEYMLPQTFQFLAALPLTPTGKLDRLQLRAAPEIARHSEGRLPETPAERRIQRAWEAVLGIEGIRADEDFFALGGDSLLAAALAVALDKHAGRVVDPALVYAAPTISAMAVALEGGARAGPNVVWFNRAGSRPPLVTFAGAGGSSMSVLGLSEALGEGQPICVPEYAGLAPGAALDASVHAIATRALAAIESAGLSAPYRLCGFSSGGLVAFEVARRLRARGDEVALVALLDTASPPLRRRPAQRRLPFRRRAVRRLVAMRLRATAIRYALHQPLRRPISAAAWARYARDVHSAAARAYSPGPLDARVVLFGAVDGVQKSRSLPPDLGWKAHLGDRLECIEVPGGHDLMREPYVHDLARALGLYLSPGAAARS